MKHFVRIAKTNQFDAIYKKADKIWHTPLFVLFYKETQGYNIGFVASKKIGNAVKRNRAKRLLRAHFLIHSDNLMGGSYIFVAKPPLIEAAFDSTQEIFLATLKRTSLLR